MWSGVGTIDVYEASSVERSMVENVSSPTLLMREVIRTVRDVLGKDGAVGGGLAAATDVMPDTPVSKRAAIAMTESFLTAIKFFSFSAPSY